VSSELLKVNFNADSFADLLWHNGATGASQAWNMNGATRLSFLNFDSGLNVADSSGWTPVGIVSDGTEFGPRRDVIWHNGSTGQTQLWIMNANGTRDSFANTDPSLNMLDSSGWRFAAVGQFNGIRNFDWVWHNGTTGQTQIWFMDGSVGRTGFVNLDSSLNLADSSGWTIAGADDFDNGGTTDLVWHNGTTGQTQVWFMSGGTRLGFTNLDSSLNVADSSGWRFVSVQDMDGDGHGDIIIHNGATGQTQIWFMSGTTRTSFVNLPANLNLPDSTGWRIVRS
jgi:hypothetical protein